VIDATRSVSTRRIVLYPIAAFGILSIMIAALGVYGLLNYSVTQRSREIAIQIALGAPRARVLRSTIGDGLKLAGWGVATGLAASLVLTRLLTTFLYETDPLDILTLGLVSVSVVALAALVAAVPAFRAVRIDPIIAIKGPR
jgi:ABC-type antimicrobial peptide transport system permease subunit